MPDTRTGAVTGLVNLVITNVGVTPITITSVSLATPPEITDFDPRIGAARNIASGCGP